MKKESKLNLNAGDYAISHCDSDKTYNGLEVHKMLCDAYIAGSNDTFDDEAYRKAYYDGYNKCNRDWIYSQEDEKIRHYLMNFVKINDGVNLPPDYAKKALAWLERQGEHANFRDKIQVGDKVTRNEAGVLVNLSQLNRVAKKNEKQCEQKFEMKSAEESLGIDSDTCNKIVDECILGEPKPEENNGNIGGISPNWSEEDERNLQGIIDEIEANKNQAPDYDLATYDRFLSWLQSLQDRVQPKPMCKFGDTELTNEELCEGLILGMINEHNRVTKEILRNEYEKGRADVLAKIDAIDVDEMVCESGATSRVTQYWYAHGVNDVIKKLKEEQV